jgi:hypothetical protein
MFLIPGRLFALLTFPGVVVHELAYHLCCDLAKVPVYKVCYFEFGNPSGYVIHKQPENLKSSFFITIGPFIINTILCSFLTFPSVLSGVFSIVGVGLFGLHPIFWVMMWLGLSVGIHAFPSNIDVSTFMRLLKASKPHKAIVVFAGFIAFIIKIANALRVIWVDVIFAYKVSFLLPAVVTKVLQLKY